MIDLASLPVSPPCYICDLDALRGQYRRLAAAFSALGAGCEIAYSYKTNYVPAICRALHDEGAWAEVVSLAEYSLARRLGVAPQHIVFNGTGRPMATLVRAFSDGARVNLDSLDEVRTTAEWAHSNCSSPLSVGLRVAPLLPDGEMAGQRSRFGLDPSSGELREAADMLRSRGLVLRGLHAHVSSKSRSLAVFESLVSCLAEASAEIPTESLEYLDFGGGLGFLASESAGSRSFPSIEDYAKTLAAAFERRPFLGRGLRLVIEPGMALVNHTVSYLTRILAVKRTDTAPLLVIHGGIHEIKPTRHQHNPHMIALGADGREKSTPLRSYDVVGNTCMEDDYVARHVRLPDVQAGDLLLVHNVGAYTLVFRPPFIHPPPAVVTLSAGCWGISRPAPSWERLFDGYELPG